MLYFVFSFCSSFCRKDNTRQKLSTKTIDLRSKTDLQFHHEFQLQFIPPTVVQEHFQDHSGYKREWHCTIRISIGSIAQRAYLPNSYSKSEKSRFSIFRHMLTLDSPAYQLLGLQSLNNIHKYSLPENYFPQSNCPSLSSSSSLDQHQQQLQTFSFASTLLLILSSLFRSSRDPPRQPLGPHQETHSGSR